MSRASDQKFLHDLIHKEARCLLQFISEASPWAPDNEQGTLNAILKIARHESHQIAQLVRYCVKNKLGVPAMGAYPEHFMDLNFAALSFLLPKLIEDQKKRIAELEWAVLSLPPQVHGIVQDLSAAKKKHLDKMQAMLPAAAA